ncbi:metallophosphoesterase [Halorubrum sp. DTA46]|uniref:metallophosphoesterase n=1 Tax=Halorubrum sp. DTA46 TaxID=3402162 RepID=UPI003AACCF75
MLIGIISDTHDDAAAVEAAVALFERERVDAVVHCGDFVAPFSVTPFASLVERDSSDDDTASAADGVDFHAVRGNNDGEWAVQSAVESFGTYHGEAATLAFDGREVAVTHGTSGVVVDALVDCGDCDYVLHGHTHAHAAEARDGTVRVNPGGLPIPVEGADDRFRVATIDTTAEGVDAVTHHALER